MQTDKCGFIAGELRSKNRHAKRGLLPWGRGSRDVSGEAGMH